MTEEWKWRVGVDTEPASRSFDDLARRARDADSAMEGVAQVVERLEAALQSLNQIGTSGLDALAAIQGSMEAGFAGVETRLSGVLGRLTQLINISREAATSQSSSWGQGATAVERYSERIAKASLELTELRHKADQLGKSAVVGYGTYYGGEEQEREGATVGELYPDIEEHNRAMSQFAQGQIGLTDQSAEAQLRVQRILNAQNTEVTKYISTLQQVEQTETKIAHLTELEARARQKVGQAAAEQSAAMPESRTAGFFTERTETEWSSKYGLGEMTGFEQSMLKVLTTFDQLRATGQETKITFADIIQTLEHLGAMRFTSIGTSIRTNIRQRLEESVAATLLLIQTLEKLDSMQPGVATPATREMATTEQPRPRGAVGYWAGQAGAPTAQVVTEMTTMSEQVAQTFDKMPEGAARATNRILKYFTRLKSRVSGGSIVPDMVREVNMWLMQIGGMGSLSGIEGIGQKFLEVQRQMQSFSLFEKGGLPGFGEQRQEIVTQMIGPYKEILEQAQSQMGGMMAKAGPAQWQQVQAPSGEVVPVTPSFVMQQAGRETAEYEAKSRTLISTEKELALASDKVATSLFNQAKQTRTKADILKDLQRGTVNAKDAEQQLATMTEEAEKSTEKATALSGRFMRHIAWIFQGIFIWGAIRGIKDLAGQFAETFSTIEVSAVQAAFIVEGSLADMMDAQRDYARMAVQYGIGPGEAATFLPTAERFGMADPKVADAAGKLTLISDEEMDMAEASEYLMSVMRQWNITIDDNARVLDTLVTMYAEAPGSMKGFLDLMREGPGLAEQMGQSFEENMLLIAKAMSYLPGRTAGTVSGTMGRMLSRIYRPDAAKKLAQEHEIGVFDPETLARRPGLEVLDDIARKFQEITNESERAALAEMVAGTRGHAAWRDAYVMLTNWHGGIREADTALRDHTDLVDAMGETHKTTLEVMSASWKNYIEILGETSGAIAFIDNAIRGLAESFQYMTRGRAIMQEAETKGYSREDLYAQYEQVTGQEAVAPAYTYGKQQRYPQKTEEFMSWADEFLNTLTSATVQAEPYEGWALPPTAGQVIPDLAAERLKQRIAEAGQLFEDSVKRSSEDFRKTILVTMLATGWTPGTGVVDLSEYSTAQITRAQQQSSADTQRMVSGYREFLQGQGLGGEGLDKAMQNFTNKMIMQLQFFRLPGGQIKLMEGRDLLFYLSKIEENTRPLEGIWNVPEGMRVWVPIESTFYGEWRQRQEEGVADGQEVTLDASAFDTAVGAFGGHISEMSAWEVLATQYPTMDEGGTVWDQRMNDYFKWMDFLVSGLTVDPDQPYMGYAGAAERAGLGPEFGSHVDRFGVAADTAAGALLGISSSWVERAGLREERNREVAAQSQVQAPQPTPDVYLPLIMKGLSDLYPNDPFGIPAWDLSNLDVSIPEPLGVSVPINETAQGTALGMMNTGMPTAMGSMQISMSAMGGSIASQLYYLMIIAANTAQAPVVNVTGDTGSVSVSGGGRESTPTGDLMADYQMSPMSGVVPI